jgi:hypothetical protein
MVQFKFIFECTLEWSNNRPTIIIIVVKLHFMLEILNNLITYLKIKITKVKISNGQSAGNQLNFNLK